MERAAERPERDTTPAAGVSVKREDEEVQELAPPSAVEMAEKTKKLERQVKRLKGQLRAARMEAEERQALLRLSKERLVDIIIDAKYHSGAL